VGRDGVGFGSGRVDDSVGGGGGGGWDRVFVGVLSERAGGWYGAGLGSGRGGCGGAENSGPEGSLVVWCFDHSCWRYSRSPACQDSSLLLLWGGTGVVGKGLLRERARSFDCAVDGGRPRSADILSCLSRSY